MDKRHDVELLNSLIVTTIDSALGFEESARDVRNRRYEGQFRAFAGERRQLIGRLQAQVRQLGGTPADDGSAKAAAHRRWVDFKDAVTGRSDKAVISEVNNAETYIRNKYEAALKDEKLSPETRSILEEGIGSVRAGHFFAKRLDQALSSGASDRGGWALKLAGAAGLAGAAYAAYRMFGPRLPQQERRGVRPWLAHESDGGPQTDGGVGMAQSSHASSASSPSDQPVPSATIGATAMTAGYTGATTVGAGTISSAGAEGHSAFAMGENERGQHPQAGERTGNPPEAEGAGYAPSIDKTGL